VTQSSEPELVTVQALYVASDLPIPEGGQALVTIWSDGTAEIAFRADQRDRWGIPTPMEARPTE